jgi:2-oxoglutarate ferredoxin oxidoreductase subunit gamma
MTDIRFSGLGGQGIVRCGLITGKALALYDNKHATMTQSFGPEARGSACSAQLVVADERVLYPYIDQADILIAMSQEAYEKYEPQLKATGIFIYDLDLVKIDSIRDSLKTYAIPATRLAETLGNRIFTNLVMLGFFTAVSKVVSAEAMKSALPGLVPERFLQQNIKAFQTGYDYGLDILSHSKAAAP